MKTPNRIAYDKEIRRINRFIKTAEARGFTFDKEAIREMIPEPGSRITKQKIEILKSIKPEKLYAKATYREPGTGRVMSGFRGREAERKKAAYKGQQTKKAKGAGGGEGSGGYDWVDGTTTETASILYQLDEMMNEYWAPGYNGFMNLIGNLIGKFGSLEEAAKYMDDGVLDVMYHGVLWESDGSSEQRASYREVIRSVSAKANMTEEETDEMLREDDDENV